MTSLVTENKEDWSRWNLELRKITIQSDFHARFTAEKQIG
jgi:hypothetical protein